MGMNVADEPHRPRKTAHVIVCGNEKGGSGKSTIAVHLTIALLKAGFRVAAVDLDSRQLSFTRYLENRKAWARKSGINLLQPSHFHVKASPMESLSASESKEFSDLVNGMAEIEHAHDFVVVDTPGSDTYLNRLAHMMADTLVTPMNDSFIDFDVLARIDPENYEILEYSQYAKAVRAARRERRAADSGILDWIVVRNRIPSFGTRNEHRIQDCLRRLSHQLGFRLAEGISERVIFREFFPIGLTALDDFDELVLGTKPTLSHLSARQETRQLVSALRLPIDAVGRRRVESRRGLSDAMRKPLVLPDIFVS